MKTIKILMLLMFVAIVSIASTFFLNYLGKELIFNLPNGYSLVGLKFGTSDTSNILDKKGALVLPNVLDFFIHNEFVYGSISGKDCGYFVINTLTEEVFSHLVTNDYACLLSKYSLPDGYLTNGTNMIGVRNIMRQNDGLGQRQSTQNKTSGE